MRLSDIRDFIRRPHADRQSIRKFQDCALRRVVGHAATKVPYYRELFRRAGLKPSDISTAEDLRALPVTTKRELQSRPVEDFLAEGWDKSRGVRLTTSGSTGHPTVVFRSKWEQLKLQAYRLRAQAICGVGPRDLRASIHARSRAIPAFNRWGPYRLASVPAGDPAEMLRAMRRLQPDVVSSRPSVFEQLALASRREQVNEPNIRLAFAGAEILTPAVRRLVEETWGCRVFNEYGTNEFVLVAGECPECGLMHTCDDAVIVEVLGEDRPAAAGESGRVVCTGLHSFAMPLIRFDLGDVAMRPALPQQCSMGFDAIEVVEGRRLDFLTLAGGKVVSPYTLQRAIQDVPGVSRFQVEQRSLEALRVRLERAGEFDPSRAVAAAVSRLVPADVRVAVETVSSIDPPPGQKHRYIRGLAAASDSTGS